MKILWGFFFYTILSVSSWAASNEHPTKYLSRMQGVALETLTDHREVKLAPGTTDTCKKTTAGSDWSFFRCSLTNAYALFSRMGGLPLHVMLNDATVTYSNYKETPSSEQTVLRKYAFYGSYEEAIVGLTLKSRVEIELWEFDNNPGDVRGWIRLLDYRKETPVQMVYSAQEF